MISIKIIFLDWFTNLSDKLLSFFIIFKGINFFITGSYSSEAANNINYRQNDVWGEDEVDYKHWNVDQEDYSAVDKNSLNSYWSDQNQEQVSKIYILSVKGIG